MFSSKALKVVSFGQPSGNVVIVTALYKSGSTSDVTIYWPIGIMSKISFLFERLLFNFLYPKIQKKRFPRNCIVLWKNGAPHRSFYIILTSYTACGIQKPLPSLLFWHNESLWLCSPWWAVKNLSAFSFDKKISISFWLLPVRTYTKREIQLIRLESVRCHVWCSTE